MSENQEQGAEFNPEQTTTIPVDMLVNYATGDYETRASIETKVEEMAKAAGAEVYGYLEELKRFSVPLSGDLQEDLIRLLQSYPNTLRETVQKQLADGMKVKEILLNISDRHYSDYAQSDNENDKKRSLVRAEIIARILDESNKTF